MTTPRCIIVTTTVATAAQARALADDVVRARLAACVQVTAIRSTYRWKGKIAHAAEHLLVIKTRAARSGALAAYLRAHHPYEIPEIVVTPITGGLPAYLDWVAAETRPAGTRRNRIMPRADPNGY